MTIGGTGAGTGQGKAAARKGWGLAAGEAESILADARRALLVMAGVLALLWVIQLVNFADGYRLNQEFAIQPRDVASLPDILTAPFLHLGWAHIEGNSGPLFIFGFLAAYRGIRKFVGVTALVILTSGLAAWLTASQAGVGASGVVFGYFGYLMVRGFFDRRPIDMLIGVIMALCFAYQFAVLLPHAGIGWQDHIGGLLGGIVAGWVFRDRRARAAAGTGTAGAKPSPALPGGSGKGATGPVDRAELLRKIDEMGI